MSCMQWVSVAEPLLQRNTVSALKTFLQCYHCTLIIICSFLQDFDPLTVKRTNVVVQPLQRLQRHRKGGMNTTGNNSRGGRSKEKHLRFQKAHVRHRKWKKWVVFTGLTLSFTSLQSLLWLLPSPRRGGWSKGTKTAHMAVPHVHDAASRWRCLLTALNNHDCDFKLLLRHVSEHCYIICPTCKNHVLPATV